MTLRRYIILATATELTSQAAERIITNVRNIDPNYKNVLAEPGRLITLVQSAKSAQEIWTAVHLRTVSLNGVKVLELGWEHAVGHDMDLISWFDEKDPFGSASFPER